MFIWTQFIRLIVSTACGLVIGIDREYRGKGAGIRTHMMVSLAACLMMILSKYAFFDLLFMHENVGGIIKLDPSRVAAGIVTAIGFLGAGLIVVQPHVITGLTTSAGIWATVGVGMCFGAGLYAPGLMATGLIVAINLCLNRFLSRKHNGQMVFTFLDDTQSIDEMLTFFKTQKFMYIELKADYLQKEGTVYTMSFHRRQPMSVDHTLKLVEGRIKVHSLSLY